VPFHAGLYEYRDLRHCGTMLKKETTMRQAAPLRSRIDIVLLYIFLICAIAGIVVAIIEKLPD
jgi:hypothetical protein